MSWFGCSASPEDEPKTEYRGSTCLDNQIQVARGIGLDAFARLEDLPLLKRHTRAFGASSASDSVASTVGEGFDPNDDYSNYVRVTESERVLLDVRGAGAIYRFWHTDDAMDAWAPSGSNAAGTPLIYNFYFDDAITPQLVVPSAALWSGNLLGFPAQLSLNADASSGGAVLYRPIPFARALRVTLLQANAPRHDYFNIAYSLYSGVPVATFDGQEDTQLATSVLAHVGDNPIPQRDEDRWEHSTFDLLPDTMHEVARFDGSGLITELTFDVPDMRREQYPVLTDNGRALGGTSYFQLSVASDNQGVRLKRRFEDARPQRANVYVDDAHVGTWSTGGGGDSYSPTRAANAWRDASFEIPAEHTSGKELIHVRIEVVKESEGASWNEFRYWAVSKLDGAETVTDELDVGDPDSEMLHAYAHSELQWEGTRDYRPLDPVVIAGGNDGRGLERVRLKIFWDGASEPAVDAPFSQFFGTGAGFVAEVKALMLGHQAGHFYSYFPMAYQRSARVVLEAPPGVPTLRKISARFRIRPLAVEFRDAAYFHAESRAVDQTTVGRDYEILSVEGQGHYVGANLILPGVNWTLEGDERIYVDGLRSPSISGTGTEDYVNGGWYFSRGPFTAAFSGAPERAASTHPVSIYRHHILDAVPFRTSLRVTLEHDGINSNQVPYASVAYYYHHARAGMVRTDFFQPADPTSASAHQFAVGDEKFEVESAAGSFFADDLTHPQMRSGVVSRTSTAFEIQVDPRNDGVVLRRVSDQTVRDQMADVYIDESFAGTWFAAGGSDHIRWREDEFWVPADRTQGRSSLRIRLEVRSAKWTAYEYTAFALTGAAAGNPSLEQSAQPLPHTLSQHFVGCRHDLLDER